MVWQLSYLFLPWVCAYIDKLYNAYFDKTKNKKQKNQKDAFGKSSFPE